MSKVKKENKGRLLGVICAVLFAGLICLTVFLFLNNGWNAVVESWKSLNGIFSNILFEFNIAALSYMVVHALVSGFAFFAVIFLLFNCKCKKTVLKPILVLLCIEKLLYCAMLLMKVNLYWNSPLISNNIVVWIVLMGVAVFEFVVALLLTLMVYGKRVFAAVTIVFSSVVGLTMIAQIVNTHFYKFIEIPLLPDIPVWQQTELLNEGIANITCYSSLCFAVLGVFLSAFLYRTTDSDKKVVDELPNMEEGTVVVPKLIVEEDKQEMVDDIPALIPEIDTDENIKIDIDLEEELKEIIAEEAEAVEPEIVAEAAEPEIVVENEEPVVELPGQEELLASLEGLETEVPEEPQEEMQAETQEDLQEEMHEETAEETEENVVEKMAADQAATQLINLTLRLQKGEITNDEYEQMKQDLFECL